MPSFRRAVLYGLGVWLVPFVVAFLIFPIRESNRPLFESIMPVAVAAAATGFGLSYLRHAREATRRDGMTLGLLWLGISVVIDAPLMLLGGPMRMTIAEYVADIAITYLLIPVVTTGLVLARGTASPGPTP